MPLTTIVPLFALLTAVSSQQIGSCNLHQENITLSGYSSGGAFSQMMLVSYSSLFKGVATFSHTYYRCGYPDADIDNWDRYCTMLFNLTDKEIYNPMKVHDDIKEYLSLGLIEDPANLKDKRLYVYTGLRSWLFSPRQALNILQVFEPYIQNLQKIKVRVQDAEQVLPSNTYGGACTESADKTEYIANCGFSGVTEAINFILYDDSESLDAFEKYNVRRGKVSPFDQAKFTKDLKNHNMDDVGFYYIPKKCRGMSAKCPLHIYFHGCFAGREFMGSRHVENTGLLELAERKGIVLLFPQAKSSPLNKIGCWDTFGVSGKYYATQKGPQVEAVKRMIDYMFYSAQH